jgi:Fungal specific transcription factor domain
MDPLPFFLHCTHPWDRWDITIALISRREPLLPETYLQTIGGYDRDQKDGWTFFILNGCPAELAMAMRRLARLASIYEKASSMEWTTFNTTPVDIITKEVTQWRNHEDVTVDEAAYLEDDMDGRRNRFHCTEAWRCAILLYARRVFVQRQDASGLRSINYLTREILDHIRCIPKTATVQKQVLLPVFLAGAEVGDEPVRDFVRDYCSYWSAKSGYLMFNTVATLLETIWTEWDVSIRDSYWWGVKVNNTASSPLPGEQLQVSELLLG